MPSVPVGVAGQRSSVYIAEDRVTGPWSASDQVQVQIARQSCQCGVRSQFSPLQLLTAHEQA